MQKPDGHRRRQHGTVTLVLNPQAVKKRFHIGVSAVRSDGSLGRVSHREEGIDLVGDGACLIGGLCKSFGTKVNRERHRVKRVEGAPRNNERDRPGENRAPSGSFRCGGIDARHYPGQAG